MPITAPVARSNNSVPRGSLHQTRWARSTSALHLDAQTLQGAKRTWSLSLLPRARENSKPAQLFAAADCTAGSACVKRAKYDSRGFSRSEGCRPPSNLSQACGTSTRHPPKNQSISCLRIKHMPRRMRPVTLQEESMFFRKYHEA